MYILKYLEKDGIIVYTDVSNWSEKRREEFALREWHPMNSEGEDA